MKASDSFRFEIDRRGESHCQLTVLSQNTSSSFALARAAASVIARSQRVARMRARNLPVVTSECVCDTLVRRANPFPRGKRCQGFVRHCHDGKSIRTVVLATRLRQGFAGGSRVGSPELQRRRQARTHTPRPLLRQGSGRLSANHNDRWLWVPAFAGTTGKAGGNAADRTRDKLENRTPFFERLWPAMTTKGHTSYLRCFLDIVSPAMA
jgi:hypothetical protein